MTEKTQQSETNIGNPTAVAASLEDLKKAIPKLGLGFVSIALGVKNDPTLTITTNRSSLKS